MRDKKQTSVSLSSTESEVISLDADLRVEGLLVLHSRDVVIEVYYASKNTHQAVRYLCRKEKVDPKHQPQHQIEKKQRYFSS